MLEGDPWVQNECCCHTAIEGLLAIEASKSDKISDVALSQIDISKRIVSYEESFWRTFPLKRNTPPHKMERFQRPPATMFCAVPCIFPLAAAYNWDWLLETFAQCLLLPHSYTCYRFFSSIFKCRLAPATLVLNGIGRLSTSVMIAHFACFAWLLANVVHVH